MINLRPEYAARAIVKFFSDANGENHRYRSWEHCYLAFANARKSKMEGKEIDFDYLSLHLANYLSSWGMLRNSFLLDRDYRTHLGIIDILFEDEYLDLWTCLPKPEKNQLERFWDMIIEIRERLVEKYVEGSIPNVGKPVSVTDTLLTKILLGTCGCIPAYDRFYELGVGCFGGTQSLGQRSYSEIVKYHRDTWEMINKHLNNVIPVTKDDPTVSYPPMKLMDMCIWQIGYHISEFDKENYDEKTKTGRRFKDLSEDEKYHVLDELMN